MTNIKYDEINNIDSCEVDYGEFDEIEDIITDEKDIEIDRITIFKHLAVNQIDNTVNKTIFENLLNEYYSDFIIFCDQVKNSSEKIETVTCYIESGKLKFDTQIEDK